MFTGDTPSTTSTTPVGLVGLLHQKKEDLERETQGPDTPKKKAHVEKNRHRNLPKIPIAAANEDRKLKLSKSSGNLQLLQTQSPSNAPKETLHKSRSNETASKVGIFSPRKKSDGDSSGDEKEKVVSPRKRSDGSSSGEESESAISPRAKISKTKTDSPRVEGKVRKHRGISLSRKHRKDTKHDSTKVVKNPVKDLLPTEKTERKAVIRELRGDHTVELPKGPKCEAVDKRLIAKLEDSFKDKILQDQIDKFWTQQIFHPANAGQNCLQIFHSTVLIPHLIAAAQQIRDIITDFVEEEQKVNTTGLRNKTPLCMYLENLCEDLIGKKKKEEEHVCLGNLHKFLELLNKEKRAELEIATKTNVHKLTNIIAHLVPEKKHLSLLRRWNIPTPPELSFVEESGEEFTVASICPQKILRTIIPEGIVIPKIVINDKPVFLGGERYGEEKASMSVKEKMAAQLLCLKDLFSAIYETEFPHKTFQNLKMNDQVKLFLLLGSNGLSGSDFRDKMEAILNAEVIKWNDLNVLFYKTLNEEGQPKKDGEGQPKKDGEGQPEQDWMKIRKNEIEEIGRTDPASLDRSEGNMSPRALALLRQLIPAFNVLQLMSNTSFSKGINIWMEESNKLLEEQAIVLSPLQGVDPDHKDNAYFITINQHKYSLDIDLQLGVFPTITSLHRDTGKPVAAFDRDNKLGIFNLTLNIATMNKESHQQTVTCNDLQLNPKKLTGHDVHEVLEFLTEKLPHKYKKTKLNDTEFVPLKVTLTQQGEGKENLEG